MEQHSIGVATDAFSLPFRGGLLVFRAGQRVVAHPDCGARSRTTGCPSVSPEE